MDHTETAREILDTMLGYLGFVTQIEIETGSGPDATLQVATGEPKPLIGHRGERLDDIQYLVNRILQCRDSKAPRVRVDVDNYRATQEFRMIEDAERAAERALAAGKPMKLEPMNSYHRRIIHNHFKDHPEVKTWSPKDSARVKRISIIPKDSGS
ncbi:MAG: single-stranded DNA-binding protein [Verrucomicrobiales bacterium]|nr:single-stranded DNA-binding protein [Verrucomicrobiales bacterium]